MVLRGRSAAMSAAMPALRRAARHGQSGIVVVTGEAGIGKTAVLDAIGAQAGQMGFRTGVGKADEIGRVSPGAPVLLALRSGRDPLLDPAALAELDGLADHPLVLIDRVGTRLERVARLAPVLIEIDDVQWADQLSRLALRVLPDRLAGNPVVWLFATRDPTDELVTASTAVRTEIIPLGPLAPTDVAAIARDRLGHPASPATQRMLDGVGGNPFLVNQILDGVSHGDADGVPPAGFVRAVEAALDALPDRTVVLLAAVLGRSFAIDEAQRIVPTVGTADVDAAVASGLLARDGHRLRFRHDLVRETVYAGLSTSARQELHRRCARYLLSSGRDALAAAPHAQAAATPGDEESAAILCEAADKAVTALPDTAGDLILQAFALVRPAQGSWVGIGERCVDVLHRVQRCADAVRVADAVLARTGDAETYGRIQVLAAQSLWQIGRPAESVARIDDALAAPGVSPGLQARLRAARALALTRTEPARRARAAAESALADARQVRDHPATMLALQAMGELARNSGHHAESLAYFRELRSVSDTTYLAEEIVELQLLDRYVDSGRLLEAAHRDDRGGVEATLPSVTAAQMWQDFNLGRLDDAEAGARTLITVGREIGDHKHELDAELVFGAVAVLRGELADAANRLAPASDEGPADESVRRPGVTLMEGWLAASDGRSDDARKILAPLLYEARDARADWPWWPGWMRVFVRVGRATGDERFTGEALAIAAEGAARNPGVASFEGVSLALRGLVRHDLAALTQANQVLARSPRPMLRGNAAEDRGRMLLAYGKRAEGIAELDRAWSIYHGIGAKAAVITVQKVMRKAGARRARWETGAARPQQGWAALTDAEVKVAELISDGHTNKAAARLLNLSPNTVSTHLRSIFTKLDVQSRVQLTNAVHALRPES
ncbi:LuxR C-terminal-related transcriptional regulator [Asanoa sp. WMMD1127]|uniref:helix-turn-helix transcriptional regulator n=1 Tax=Asanoa sp. WMMD1127 TaxID=3016107 RepID=UPI0024181279|nr:LuxR family transcriptional regulator [Asanoa sp. WMMD1127]MDG4821413.1 LuxR C-terminal-related transcriptional regulator [Asanoa sp. WMMD1127]